MKTQIKQIFEALKNVPQSPVHHPEGDVHIHTALVTAEVCFAPGRATLSLWPLLSFMIPVS